MTTHKLTPGIRALLHFFGRCSHDHSVSEDWEGYNMHALKSEAKCWHEANSGFAREQLHIADDNMWSSDKGAHIFHFGAYGDHHVLAYGNLEDALEDAADTLPKGYFYTPELPADYESMSEDEQDTAHNEATTDLTYTEAGYLASWEWSVCNDLTPQDVISFIYAGEPAQ